MTFDPDKPTRIMFPLLQGVNTPHRNPIRSFIKKYEQYKKRVLKV